MQLPRTAKMLYREYRIIEKGHHQFMPQESSSLKKINNNLRLGSQVSTQMLTH